MSRFASECRALADKRPRCSAALSLMMVVVSIVGCRSTDGMPSRTSVAHDVTSRFGPSANISEGLEPGQVLIPPGVSFDDGLSDDEAVSIAMWNNAAFQELLAELGISSAQLLDAGLIADPQFVFLFPLGPKQLELQLIQSVDTLWLQPIRVRAAKLDLGRVSQVMVQNGLDVIRDVRIAHANLVLAQQQSELAREAETLRTEIATLAQKRQVAGGISELEAMTTQIDAWQAKAVAARAVQDVDLARHRLRTLIGLAIYADRIDAQANDNLAVPTQDSETLTNLALTLRPDLRAAEIAIETAGERARLARNQFLRLDAVYDANGAGLQGFESGPALQVTLPIFNRNRGGIAIADAQWQRAARQYVTVRDRVTLEVRTAHTQFEQAQQNLRLLREDILPFLKQAQELARRNFEIGGATYFLILQTTGQYIDARMRELQLVADLRRAIAELERSVGQRVERTELPSVPVQDLPGAIDEPDELDQGSNATRPSLQAVSHKVAGSEPLPHADDSKSKAELPTTSPVASMEWSTRSKAWRATRTLQSEETTR